MNAARGGAFSLKTATTTTEWAEVTEYKEVGDALQHLVEIAGGAGSLSRTTASSA